MRELWRIRDRNAGAFGSYQSFEPREFCAEHYPELKHFYLALQAGRSPAAALRRAQMSLLQEGLPPFIWAPFQLAGDPGPLPAS